MPSLQNKSSYIFSCPQDLVKCLGSFCYDENRIDNYSDFKTSQASIPLLSTLAHEYGNSEVFQKPVAAIQNNCEEWLAGEKVKFFRALPGGPEALGSPDMLGLSNREIANRLEPWVRENLASIRSLDLADADLHILPEEITLFENLKQLFLDGNPLEELTDRVGTLKKLELLSLQNGHLKKVSPAIGQLKKLKTLRLTGSKDLRSLPKEIQNLKRLQFLDLYDNGLDTLPKLHKLRNLRELMLGQNLFRQFPEAVLSLPFLENLILSNNDLENVPENIYRLENLAYLNLFGNEIKSLPVNSLRQMVNLEGITIECNPIMSALPEDVMVFATEENSPLTIYSI